MTTARGLLLFVPGVVALAFAFAVGQRGTVTRRDGYVLRRSERPAIFWSLVLLVGGYGIAAIGSAMALWGWL